MSDDLREITLGPVKGLRPISEAGEGADPAECLAGTTDSQIASSTNDIREQNKVDQLVCRTERLSAIGTLAAGIAHEINNPLASALVATETAQALLEDRSQVDIVSECLRESVVSLERCGKIVHNILTFARGGKSEREKVDLGRLASRAVDFAREYAMRREIELHLDVPTAPVEAKVNSLEIELAFINLLRNAIEASGERTQIEIVVKQDGNEIEVSILDRGKGMTADQVTKLFDPFFTTRLQDGGTGLGSSMAYGIVQSHGGQILVESACGRGTEIRILLPDGSVRERARLDRGESRYGENSDR